MRKDAHINPITGEIRPNYKPNSTSTRFASLEAIQRIKETQPTDAITFGNRANVRRLGTAQDHDLFQYSYGQNRVPRGKQDRTKTADDGRQSGPRRVSQPLSLVNASKTGYNIISHANHAQPHGRNWSMAKKSCPVSKFTEMGRMFASNYSQAYKNEPKFGKQMALCSDVCEMQRSYGTDKFFRKYK